MANGFVGFVSKRWTRVITAGADLTANSISYSLEVIDVGTGLSVVVQGVDFTLIYDGGSNDDLATGENNRVLAYLKQRFPSLSTIDHMVLSHPHRDHVELLPDLFEQYAVKDVWDSGRVNDICGYRSFLKAIQGEAGVRYHNALQNFGSASVPFGPKTCYGRELPEEKLQLNLSARISDDPIPLGQGAWMTILHADGGSHPSANENSLVVRLNLGNTRVLLTGDAEGGGRKHPSTPPSLNSVEGELLACCRAELAAQILIAGHHGSMTSSREAFLDAVSPSTMVISSGPTKYGSVTLPDAVIVAGLAARGQVFRTDRDDQACAANAAKIGSDADGRPGGCDNVRIVIRDAGPPVVTIWQGQ